MICKRRVLNGEAYNVNIVIPFSSIGNGGTSAVLDGANSLPIVLFKKWGKSLGIKMEFFETALVLD